LSDTEDLKPEPGLSNFAKAIIALVVVIGVLVIFPIKKGIERADDAAKVAETRAEVMNCRLASLLFYTNVSRWPINLPELVTHTNGPFIYGNPGLLDSWGRPLIYVTPVGTNGSGSVRSLGKDGLPGGTNLAADIILTIP
jgi:hypothetical protein